MNEISSIIRIASNKQEQLFFLVHSGEDNGNGLTTLATFLMNYLEEIDLGMLDKNGMNAWHYVCKLGKLNMFQLLLNI